MEEKIPKLRTALTPREQPPAVTDGDLADLQARAKTLYASQTVTDEELYAVQDLCADYVELQASVPQGGMLTTDIVYSKFYNCASAAKLHALVQLSRRMADDEDFARQLKRKL